MNTIIQCGNLTMYIREHEVFYGDQEIKLTNREFEILCLLMENRGQVFTKRQIYDCITDRDARDNYHTIEITISRIRKKLEQCSGRTDFILTIRGGGYKFNKRII